MKMMNRINKVISIFIVIGLFITSIPVSFAMVTSMDGGLMGDPTMDSNTYEYQEVLFISGEPIELSGSVKVPTIPTDKDTYKASYTYELYNTAKSATLERTVSYEVTKEKNDALSQTVTKVEITSLDEEIVVGGVTYTLGGYIFDESSLTDNTPAVDYYSGSIYFKRTFYKNGDAKTNKGKVIVEATSDTVIGFNHQWGGAETQIMDYKITYTPPVGAADDDVKWQGFATARMASNNRVAFEYIGNDPQNISFRGSYVQKKNQENILQYAYDLPTIDGGNVSGTTRNDGELNLRRDVVLDRKNLITPKIRDIGGYWAEDSIFLLSSLDIFRENSNYFAPDLAITRADFSVALANAIGQVSPLTQTEQVKLYRNTSDHPYYDYDPSVPMEESELERMMATYNHVKFLKDTGVMMGVGDTKFFYPETPIKRSEAIQMMVRSLGLQDLAPAPPYKTHYVDDEAIPNWAKDSIYMANEIGLITGYDDGTIRPNNFVSRGEAAVFIEKLIDHIKDNITYDYREKIINRD